MTGSPATHVLRVLVVYEAGSAEQSADAELLAGLCALGYSVSTVRADALELPAMVERFAPDAIIIDSESDARDTLEHVVFATRDAPRPIALFTDYSDTSHVPELLRRGVSAYIVAGLNPARLKPILEVAVARFEHEQQLRSELADAKARLEDRKRIDRAKAILMKKGLSEDEAHQRLTRMAMECNLRIGEIAQRVIDMADLIG